MTEEWFQNHINTAKAKKQFKKRKQMQDEDNGKILTVAAEEEKRLREGGVNWALFNYILYRVDFRDCKTAAESCRLVYETMWPFINRMIKDKKELKDYIEMLNWDQIDPPDSIVENLGRKDPIKFAEETLKEITAAARKRSRQNQYGVETEKKIKL